jgi:hypothetical protein
MRVKLLAVLGCVVAMATSVVAGPRDVEIGASRERLDQQKDRASGPVNVTTTEIVYGVTVTNKTFKTLPEVKVAYMIFHEESRPGDPKPVEVSSTGSEVLANLESNRPITFTTKPIKLSKSELDAGYYWATGAKAKQKDRVTGVWIKAIAPDGEVIGEYANPSTVAKKNIWKN